MLAILFSAYSKQDIFYMITPALDLAKKEIAIHCENWGQEDKDAYLDSIRLAFTSTTPENITQRKIKRFIQSFPDYIVNHPKKIDNREQVRYLCKRTKWHIELFLSNPLMQPEECQVLQTQVEMLAQAMQQEIFKSRGNLPREGKKKAIDMFSKAVMQVARNVLLPSFKRVLTKEEFDLVRKQALQGIKKDFAQIDLPALLDEQQLLELQMSAFSRIAFHINLTTKPEAPSNLLQAEKQYMAAMELEQNLQAGQKNIEDIFEPSLECMEYMEFVAKEFLFIYWIIAPHFCQGLFIY